MVVLVDKEVGVVEGRLAETIPQAMVWADGHRHWAVVVPLLK